MPNPRTKRYASRSYLIDDRTVPTIPVNMSEMSPVVKVTIDALNQTYTAAQTLGGQRAVIASSDTLMDYADKDTPSHENRVIGVTKGAVTIGTKGSVQNQWLMTEPSWAWTPGGLIFLGNNGMLTQTVPTTGFSLILGTALAPTVIQIHIGEVIELA